jgi:hypothetical protein
MADYLGVVSHPIVPPLASSTTVGLTVIGGAVVGLAVGVRSRRVTPAAVLRAE